MGGKNCNVKTRRGQVQYFDRNEEKLIFSPKILRLWTSRNDRGVQSGISIYRPGSDGSNLSRLRRLGTRPSNKPPRPTWISSTDLEYLKTFRVVRKGLAYLCLPRDSIPSSLWSSPCCQHKRRLFPALVRASGNRP